jgi:Zn-dependent protease with chaperone function
MTKGFWATIAVGLKPRMTVRLSVFLSCCLVTFVPVFPINLVAFSLAILLGYVMVIADLAVFTKPIQLWWRLRRTVSWDVTPPPYLLETAKKMKVKLNKKRPYGITKIPIGAASNTSSGQIIVSENILSLPIEEQNAVLAHELAHLRPNQLKYLYVFVYIVTAGSALFSTSNPIIQIVATTSLFLLVRTFINHSMEYDADRIGTKYIPSPNHMVSALRHLAKPEQYDKPSDTHPSINARISKLLTPNQPRWVPVFAFIIDVVATKSFTEEFLDSFITDLNEYCQGRSRIARLSIVTIELIKAVVILGIHRR